MCVKCALLLQYCPGIFIQKSKIVQYVQDVHHNLEKNTLKASVPVFCILNYEALRL